MTEKFDKHVPVDHSGTMPAVYFDQAAAGQVPATFDQNFIKRELVRIQGNSSLVTTYISAVRAKFKLAKQQNVITAMTELNKAVASGMKSQIEMKRLEREYLDAVDDLETVKDDLEIKKLKKEDEKLDYQIKIAEKKKKIAEINEPAAPYKTKVEEMAEKRAEELEEEEAKEQHKLDKDMLKQRSKINRILRIDEEKEQKIDDLTDDYLKKYNVKRVTQLPPEVIEELEEKIEDIEDRWDQAKAES